MGAKNSSLNISDTENENVFLKRQISALKEINKISEKEIIRLSKNKLDKSSSLMNEQKTKKKLSDVSKEKLRIYVDKLLENTDNNISYLPDFVERQIYINVFGLALNLLDDILDTTSIKLLGHRIIFDLKEDLSDVADEDEEEGEE